MDCRRLALRLVRVRIRVVLLILTTTEPPYSEPLKDLV